MNAPTAPLSPGRILDCGVVGQTGLWRLRGHAGGAAVPATEARIGTMLAMCPIHTPGCFGELGWPLVLKATAAAAVAEDAPAKPS